jgi:ADP-heptose:LPS heptosyltransferase
MPRAITESFPYEPTGEHRGLLGKLLLARKLREYDFDLIINPARGEGMLENTIISFLIGARWRIGFEKDGSGFLNTVKVPFKQMRPVVEQNLDLLRASSIEPTVQSISLRIPEEDLVFGDSFRDAHISTGELLISIHTGSYWRRHLQWPFRRYIDLIKKILKQYHCKVVLLGTKEETLMVHQIMTVVEDSRIINMAGKTTLTQVAAILSRSDLFIGNDSGLLHVSLALKVPSIGIFGYTSPRQVISPEGPCIALHKGNEECLYYHQPFFEFKPKEKNPIELIEVTEVLQAVKTILVKPASHLPPFKTSL